MLLIARNILQRFAASPLLPRSSHYRFCYYEASISNLDYEIMSQTDRDLLADANTVPSIPEEHKQSASAEVWREALQKVVPCCVVLK